MAARDLWVIFHDLYQTRQTLVVVHMGWLMIRRLDAMEVTQARVC